MVNDTSNDAATVPSTATGNDRVNLPAPSGKNASGKKANNSTQVQPMTATAISRVPDSAAVIRSSPSRRCRAIFSVTTIESSTNRPSAMMKPEIANWLRVKPVKARMATPIIRLSGTDTMTTIEARQPSGNKVISTSPSAMAKSRPS